MRPGGNIDLVDTYSESQIVSPAHGRAKYDGRHATATVIAFATGATRRRTLRASG